jgi:uncharacterized protein
MAEDGFILGRHSHHGPSHWRRVEDNGLALAEETPGADVLVVRLFAILHDCRRFEEGYDPEHGSRAAAEAERWRGRLFELDDAGLELLKLACTWHDKGRTSPHPTVGVCWDADRLDLTRVMIRPRAEYMSTAAGKRRAEATTLRR